MFMLGEEENCKSHKKGRKVLEVFHMKSIKESTLEISKVHKFGPTH